MIVGIHNNQYSMDIDQTSFPCQERCCKEKFLLNVHHALIQFFIVTMQGSYGNQRLMRNKNGVPIKCR